MRFKCHLSNANLSSADLTCAKLNNTNLENANLKNSNLLNADLSNANLCNANLDSARLGIYNLANIPCSGRKITVIGDMLELGDKEEEIHQKLGKYLVEKKIDAVFAYGNLSENIIHTLKDTNIFNQFYFDKKLLIIDLKSYLQDDDIIYIKGSRGMEMEDIITGLKY